MKEADYAAVRDSIRDRWEAIVEETGRGWLRITDAETSTPDERPPDGRIERLVFEVTLCPGGAAQGESLKE